MGVEVLKAGGSWTRPIDRPAVSQREFFVFACRCSFSCCDGDDPVRQSTCPFLITVKLLGSDIDAFGGRALPQRGLLRRLAPNGSPRGTLCVHILSIVCCVLLSFLACVFINTRSKPSTVSLSLLYERPSYMRRVIRQLLSDIFEHDFGLSKGRTLRAVLLSSDIFAHSRSLNDPRIFPR